MSDIADVPPIPLSIVVCDRFIIDSITKQASLIGIIQTINAPRYPARHAQMTLVAEITNGRGQVKITTNLVDVQEEDKALLTKEDIIQFNDVK